MEYKKKLKTQGFFIVRNMFNANEIKIFRDEITKYSQSKSPSLFKSSGGISIPDFIKFKQLSNTANIRHNPKLTKILNDVFGGNHYRFCQHNDIGINRVVGWHKDKLNNEYAKYQIQNIWKKKGDQSHEILKVLIYLEDHSKNNQGLRVVPKSHLTPKINTKGNILLRPNLGDVIIFDQRITHRGMERQVKDKRILVSFGFGKNNIFTDEFEKGTILRQYNQLISLNRSKVIYIHIPKTAGTYILNVLYGTNNLIAEHRKLSSFKDLKNKMIISSIRHPIDFYNSYYNFFKYPNHKISNPLKNTIQNYNNIDDFTMDLLNKSNNLKKEIDKSVGSGDLKYYLKSNNNYGFFTNLYLYYFDYQNGDIETFLRDLTTKVHFLRQDKVKQALQEFCEHHQLVYQKKTINNYINKNKKNDYLNDKVISLITKKDKLLFEIFNF